VPIAGYASDGAQVVDVAEDSIKPSPELRRLLEQLDDDDGA